MDQKIPTNSKKLLFYSALAVIVLLATSALVLFFYQKANASEIVTDSFLQIKKIRSFSVDLSFSRNLADVHLDYHKESSELSRITMIVRKLGTKKNGTFKGEALINTTDLYAWISYSQMKDVVKLINTSYVPRIEKMQSYKLLRQVLFDKKMVHFDIKTIQSQNESVQNIRNATSQKVLNNMLMDAMIIRTSMWRISSSRIGPVRYAIGFNKDRLLAYVDRQKARNPDIPATQYDVLKQLITSTNDLDKDIIVLNLDSKGLPKQITLYLPKASQRLIEKNIDQQVASYRYLIPFSSSLKETARDVANKKSKGLEEFVKITFNHINSAPKIKTPKRPIEFSTLLNSFQSELK